MAKINVSINDDLLAQIDTYAKQHFMSRSGLISFAMSQFFLAEQLPKAFSDLSEQLRALSVKVDLPDDDRKTLESIDRASAALSELREKV